MAPSRSCDACPRKPGATLSRLTLRLSRLLHGAPAIADAPCVQKNALMTKVRESALTIESGEDLLSADEWKMHRTKPCLLLALRITARSNAGATPDHLGVSVFCHRGMRLGAAVAEDDNTNENAASVSGSGVFYSNIARGGFLVLGRPGSDLLSQGLSHSTIGAEEFNGRVRDGIGLRLFAKTTRPAKDKKTKQAIFGWRHLI